MGHGELAAELIERMDRDQRARSEVAGPATGDVWARVREVDTDNTAWFRTVLDRCGWPRRSEVGADASTAAWLLAQHADLDPEFQRRCLSLLEQAVRDGEAQPSHLAYLTDRVRRAEDRPQLYGTQFWGGPDGRGPLQPQPIEDPERLDERRRSVGLGPFAEYATLMRQGEFPDQDRD
ncbi:hypothetical protein GA0074692_2621 [Micromonospora pallida]|uniref:Uncharacterized protein n=1 Tax=Micromonospora pallida TaxID=145854 RepID=A0A1C6SHB4_9ACTN|nr:DUF6624 domain-containing protein [Micromonospora pallida]SCL28871.1 hypothetical protein GA0074692_2621 [Micromonospora pallida]